MPSSIKNSSGGNNPIKGISVRKSDGTWQNIYDAFVKAADGTWKRFLSIVPNVVGQTRTNANAAIIARGLVVGTQTPSNTTDAGLDQKIVSTTPLADAPADPGSSVDYTYYNYTAPPFFPPFFPPYFPPPFFPPYFPPPFFPPPCFGYYFSGSCGECGGNNCFRDSCGNFLGCTST
jgi:hypothetical protein